MLNIATIARDLLESSAVWTHKAWPFQAQVSEGHPQVLVVGGENASGKSLFSQDLVAWAKHNHELSPITVSIRERTGAGTFEMAAMRRAMMFGNEAEASTGATSAKVVGRALETLETRAKEGAGGILLLDEPEMGLSDGYAKTLGRYIGQRAAALPERALLVVVTHNRGLARGLADGLGATPAFACFGNTLDFDQWLELVEEHSVEELLSLAERNHEGWRAAEAVYELLRKTKKKARG